MNDHDQASPSGTASSETPRRKRRYRRIALRTFLVLLTIVCVWLALKANTARRQRQAVAAFRKAGGYVLYDYEWNDEYYYKFEGEFDDAPLPGPDWLRDLVGIDFLADVVVAEFDGTGGTGVKVDLSPLANFTNLRCFSVLNAEISDLSPLANLTKLDQVSLMSTIIDDPDLSPLSNSHFLDRVVLHDTSIDDQNIKQLQRLLPFCEIEVYEFPDD